MSLKVFWWLAVTTIAVALAWYAYQKPVYDWDMLAYAALQYKWEGTNEAQAHQKIYNDVLTGLDPKTQAFLTTEAFDRKAKESQEFFSEQLPFYTTKPLYNALAYAGCASGLTPLQSMRFWSAFGYLLIVVCVFAVLSFTMKPVLAFIFSLIIAVLPVVSLTARLLTPDTVSSAVVLIAFSLYLLHRRFHAAMILLLMSIGFRPDNAVLAVPAAFAFVFVGPHRDQRLYGLLYAVSALMLYLLIGYGFNGYGWKITFQHSILDLSRPVQHWMTTPLTVNDYLNALIAGTKHYQQVILPAIFFSITGIAATIALIKQRVFDNGLVAVVIVLLVSICLKFPAFPRFDVRYYVPQYVFALMLIVMAVVSQRHGKNASDSSTKTS